MEEKYTLHTLLAALTGLACLTAVAVRAFLPAVILPRLDLPAVAGLAIAALVLECYLTKAAPRRQWVLTALLGGLTFGLLPLCAGLADAGEALRLGLAGAVAFTVLTVLFTAIRDRLSSGPAGKLAPLLTGGVLFLACQVFAGMIL